jgi:hypothetical protein
MNPPLHLFSFKTPTLWAVMSGEGVAYCASSMRNGVKETHGYPAMLTSLTFYFKGKVQKETVGFLYSL